MQHDYEPTEEQALCATRHTISDICLMLELPEQASKVLKSRMNIELLGEYLSIIKTEAHNKNNQYAIDKLFLNGILAIA